MRLPSKASRSGRETSCSFTQLADGRERPQGIHGG